MFRIIDNLNQSQSTEDLDFFLNEMCASADVYNESVVDDIKKKDNYREATLGFLDG